MTGEITHAYFTGHYESLQEEVKIDQFTKEIESNMNLENSLIHQANMTLGLDNPTTTRESLAK